MYHFLKFLRCAAALLPSWAIYPLAKLGAFFFFDILRIKRKLILKNLSIAFAEKYSERQKTALARRSLMHFFLTISENLRSFKYPLNENVQFTGEHYIRDALAASNSSGAFLLCCHMGNWEAVGAAISRKICPAHVFVKKVGSDGLNRFVSEIREHNGFLVISRKSKGEGALKIMRILKKNEIIGFVFDQAKPAAPRVPFFGQTAKTNPVLAKIWQKNPVPIIPCYGIREGLNKHHIFFLPPLELNKDEDVDHSLENTRILNSSLEEIISSHPEQYFWLHNRWK